MSTVRAKFKVTEKSPPTDDGDVSIIKLEAVIDGSPENKDFFKWTPSGQISIGTVNAEAAARLICGQEYYVDFTPAS